MPDLIDAVIRPGLARVEFRHFIVFEEGGRSVYAAVLSECAADQNAFWEFHDRFSAADTQMFDWQYAQQYAADLGLDVETLTSCMADREHLPTVERTHREAWDRGVRGTPTVFVNGALIEEPTPANIIAAVQTALND